MKRAVSRGQDRIVVPLSPGERAQVVVLLLLDKLLAGHQHAA